MTQYMKAYAGTVKARTYESYANSELSILTKDKAQITLLKRTFRNRNYRLYKQGILYKFVIICLGEIKRQVN